MPYYRCIICNTTGKKLETLMQAGSVAELLEANAGEKNYLISYEETNATSLQDRHFFKKKKRFSRELVQEFTSIMSALLTSGNTVASSLELCGNIGVHSNGRQGSQGKLAELCTLLLDGIRKGEQFSDCLLRCSPSFPPLYMALVGIGEKTGSTAEVFKRLGLYLATSKKIGTKIQGTLFYPIFVLILALIGALLILIFIMPRMNEMFSVFNAGEEAISMKGMYTSIYLLITISLCVGGGFFVTLILHRFSKQIALAVDKILLRIPFVGVFLAALESLDFCFALELCSRTGMNAVVSLEEAQRVLRNRAYANAVGEVKEKIAAGGSLSQAFLSRSVFPPIIGQWLAVGEQTGEAEAVFTHLKNFFIETVDSFTERFLNSLEPILMLLTGLVVLLLVLQFVLPLFSLYGVIL